MQPVGCDSSGEPLGSRINRCSLDGTPGRGNGRMCSGRPGPGTAAPGMSGRTGCRPPGFVRRAYESWFRFRSEPDRHRGKAPELGRRFCTWSQVPRAESEAGEGETAGRRSPRETSVAARGKASEPGFRFCTWSAVPRAKSEAGKGGARSQRPGSGASNRLDLPRSGSRPGPVPRSTSMTYAFPVAQEPSETLSPERREQPTRVLCDQRPVSSTDAPSARPPARLQARGTPARRPAVGQRFT
jgi:hypothetical protein